MACCTRTSASQVLAFLRYRHVELITVFFCLGHSLSDTTTTNLILYKVCSGLVNVSDAEVVCANVSGDPHLERQVQVHAAPSLTANILVGHVPCVLLALFVGHWSDLHGRLPLVLLPLLGASVTQLLYWLSAAHRDWPAMSVVLASLPYGLTGQYTVLMMGFFCLLKDGTPVLEIAMRISICDAIETASNQLGSLLGGQLLKYYGSVVVFQASFSFLAVASLLAALLIRDGEGTGPVFSGIGSGCWRTLADLVDVRNVPKIVAVLGRKRERGRRRQLLLFFGALVPLFATTSGIRAILFMYCRLKLHWDVVHYSYFEVVHHSLGFIGYGVLLPSLLKLFPLADDIIGLLGTVGAIGLAVGYASATSAASMFAVTTFTMLSAFCYVAARACVFRCVTSEEAGKTLAAYSVVTAGVTSLSQVVTTQIYVATIAWFPSTCFVAFAALMLINVTIYSWSYMDNKKRDENENILADSAAATKVDFSAEGRYQ